MYNFNYMIFFILVNFYTYITVQKFVVDKEEAHQGFIYLICKNIVKNKNIKKRNDYNFK